MAGRTTVRGKHGILLCFQISHIIPSYALKMKCQFENRFHYLLENWMCVAFNHPIISYKIWSWKSWKLKPYQLLMRVKNVAKNIKNPRFNWEAKQSESRERHVIIFFLEFWIMKNKKLYEFIPGLISLVLICYFSFILPFYAAKNWVSVKGAELGFFNVIWEYESTKPALKKCQVY